MRQGSATRRERLSAPAPETSAPDEAIAMGAAVCQRPVRRDRVLVLVNTSAVALAIFAHLGSRRSGLDLPVVVAVAALSLYLVRGLRGAVDRGRRSRAVPRLLTSPLTRHDASVPALPPPEDG